MEYVVSLMPQTKRDWCSGPDIETEDTAKNMRRRLVEGSAVLGKISPSPHGTSITGCLALLAPASWAGARAITRF